jgi:hypothetical protein
MVLRSSSTRYARIEALFAFSDYWQGRSMSGAIAAGGHAPNCSTPGSDPLHHNEVRSLCVMAMLPYVATAFPPTAPGSRNA